MMTWAKWAKSKSIHLHTPDLDREKSRVFNLDVFFFLEIIEWSNIFDMWSNDDEV